MDNGLEDGTQKRSGPTARNVIAQGNALGNGLKKRPARVSIIKENAA